VLETRDARGRMQIRPAHRPRGRRRESRDRRSSVGSQLGHPCRSVG